jgi:hypothetical protein
MLTLGNSQYCQIGFGSEPQQMQRSAILPPHILAVPTASVTVGLETKRPHVSLRQLQRTISVTAPGVVALHIGLTLPSSNYHFPSHHQNRRGKAHVYLSMTYLLPTYLSLDRPWQVPECSLGQDSRLWTRAHAGPVMTTSLTDTRDSEPIWVHPTIKGREPVAVAMWTVTLRQLAYCAALWPRFSSILHYTLLPLLLP